MTIRRINLFGGPGCGKSTTAAYLFAALKERQYHAELVQEYVKTWAHEGKRTESFDQIYLLGKQIRKEDVVLRNGVDIIVTDSPVWLSWFYYNLHEQQDSVSTAIYDICAAFDSKYPPLNLFLDRGSKTYNPKGRFQTEYEAREIDYQMLLDMDRHMSLDSFKFDQKDEMLAFILETINGTG
jgi:hypothetical protein